MAETLNPSTRPKAMRARYVVTVLGFLATFIALKPQFFLLPWKVRIWEFRILLPLDLLYYLAFLLIPVPFAIFSQRVAPKWMIFGLMVANIISTFFAEFIFLYDKFDKAMVFNLVFIVELTKDILYPMMSLVISKWSPPNERSFTTSVIYSGASLGYILVKLGLEVSGTARLCVTVLLGVTWCISWSKLATNSPTQQISWTMDHEKIPKSCESATRAFRQIFTSKSFISLAAVHTCVSAVCIALTLIEYHIIQEPRSGSLPIVTFFPLHHILTAVFTVTFGGTMTLLLKRKIITTVKSRKIATVVSLLLPLFCLILAASMENTFVGCTLIMMGFVFSGAKYSGTVINIIDVAPNFSAILLAIFTTIETILIIFQAWIAESLSYVMVQGNYEVWIILMVLVGLSSLAVVFYWRHGSADVYPWIRREEIASAHSEVKVLSSESPKCEEGLNLNP